MISNVLKSFACLVIILIKGGQSVKCWMCTSASEPSCADPFQYEDPVTGTKHYLTDCEDLFHLSNSSAEHLDLMEKMFGPNAKTYCRKVIFKVYDATIVQRGCSFGDGTRDCENFDVADLCRSEVCYEDGCNAAATYDRVGLLFVPIILLLHLRF